MQSRFAWAAVLIAILFLVAYAGTVWAQVERQCSTSVNGVSVGCDTIRVGRDGPQ